MAEVAVRSRRDGRQPARAGDRRLRRRRAAREDYVRTPFRRHDLPPITDGACAVVHRPRPTRRGSCASDPCGSPVSPTDGDATTRRCATCGLAVDHARRRRRPGSRTGPIEVAELQAAFTHEEPLLRGPSGSATDVRVNLSGGPLGGEPDHGDGPRAHHRGGAPDHDGGKQRTLAHSTSGPCLQQNLVCILEGDSMS